MPRSGTICSCWRRGLCPRTSVTGNGSAPRPLFLRKVRRLLSILTSADIYQCCIDRYLIFSANQLLYILSREVVVYFSLGYFIVYVLWFLLGPELFLSFIFENKCKELFTPSLDYVTFLDLVSKFLISFRGIEAVYNY